MSSWLLLLLPTLALAQPQPATVSWRAPAECPSEPEVIRQVEGFLGQPLSAAAKHPLEIRARVAGSETSGYQLMLRMQSPQGARGRTLKHDDCAKLAEAGALLMAIAIDPERAQLREATQTAASVPPATRPGNDQASAPRSEQSRTPIRSVSGGVHLLVGAGALPGVGSGLGAEGAMTLGESFRAMVVVHYWFDRTKELEGTSGASAELGMLSGSLRGCWLWPGRWELAACLGPELGQMRGSGHELQVERSANDRWFAAALDLRLGYLPAPWLRLTLGGEAAAAVERPRFGVEGFGEVHRPEPWALRGRVGLAFRLPGE